MIVIVNGKEADVPEGTTAEQIISIMGMEPSRVAVEIDGEICPRASRNGTVLKEGQRLELVGFVGGG